MQRRDVRLVIDRSLHRPQQASKCLCSGPLVLQRSPSLYLYQFNQLNNMYPYSDLNRKWAGLKPEFCVLRMTWIWLDHELLYLLFLENY